MAVELNELMKKADRMGIVRIAGQKNEDRPVSWIHMVETPAAAEFLNGGEIAVATGSGLKKETELLPLVHAVFEKKASAMLINTGPYIPRIPEDVIRFCAQNDFPLFSVPWRVHLSDLTRIFCLEITKDRQKMQETAAAFENAIFFPKEEELYVIPLSGRGFQSEWKYAVCMFCLQNGSGETEKRLEQIAFNLSTYARRRYEKCVIFTHDREILIVAADYPENGLRALIEDLRSRALASLLPGEKLTAGCGRLTKSIRCLYKSYRQAGSIQRLQAKGKTDPSLIFYPDMGLFQILMDVDDPEIMREYCSRTIGPLIRYDEKNDSDLLQVLRTYLDHDGSVKETAAVLYAHRNTINYKLNRISEILDRNLSSLNTRLELKIGFLLEDML